MVISVLSTKSKVESNLPQIQCSGSDSTHYDRVIATIPAPALAKIIGSTNHPNQFVPTETLHRLQQHNYATTVMVVNLYYPDPDILPMQGFGYLIPRSLPVEQNPECGLGVIFPSKSIRSFFPTLPGSPISEDDAPGTKLTVMLGGHYWDDWKPTDYPDHESAVRMARTLLQRHLGITDVPTIARSRLQRDAIPQYTVGHRRRMFDLSATVQRDFDKMLVLAGNWYNGIGVNDCIKQGFLAATYGIGAMSNEPLPITMPASGKWDPEGGIPMSPVQYVDKAGPISE